MNRFHPEIPEHLRRQILTPVPHKDSEEVLRWHVENTRGFGEFQQYIQMSWPELAKKMRKYDIEHNWPREQPTEVDPIETPRVKIDTGKASENDIPYTDDDVGMTIDESVIEPYEDVRGIYVLHCEDDQWYVGCSSDIKRRLRQHFSGNGSLWTKRYHPQEIVEVEEYDCKIDKLLEHENEKTLEVMDEKGWENVRGGEWWSPFISTPPSQLKE